MVAEELCVTLGPRIARGQFQTITCVPVRHRGNLIIHIWQISICREDVPTVAGSFIAYFTQELNSSFAYPICSATQLSKAEKGRSKTVWKVSIHMLISCLWIDRLNCMLIGSDVYNYRTPTTYWPLNYSSSLQFMQCSFWNIVDEEVQFR